jgi:TolA-binding protein
VQSYTRHQLKQDKFQEATREALAQAQAHRQQLTIGLAVVLALVIVIGGFAYWRNQQEDQASALMGEAMNTYSAPIRVEGAPVDPTQLSFASAAEKDQKAEQQFQAIADKYPHAQAGKNALYMAAAVDLDAAKYSDAEAKFKRVADSGNKDLAALAKLGLASVYRATNRDQDAINIYNQLVQKPTQSVPREQAQLDLAELYEKKDPAQAKKIYDQLASDKSPTVAQIAKQRQGALGATK